MFEYLPNMTEVSISIGIWSFGFMVFTLLAKAATPIECKMLEIEHFADEQQAASKTEAEPESGPASAAVPTPGSPAN